MSGGFLFAVELLEDIRTQQAQKHDPGLRDAVVSPLGYRRGLDLADSSYLGGTAKSVDDLAGLCVHVANLRRS